MDGRMEGEKQWEALAETVRRLQERVNRLEREKYADWAGMLMDEYLCGAKEANHDGRTGE